MTKPPTYDLSDAEKRDLIELIQQNKPLPEKYRFLLFEDKREVELVWNGKSRDVCTTVLPFQTLEHIDEPRKETKRQEDLFDTRGRQTKGWCNKLIWGDNKLILASLKSGALRQQIEDAGGLKLIYIDPPFDVGADFSMDIAIYTKDGGGETFHKEPNLLEQIAYRDTWGRGADSFIAMIYERLILMRDLLAEDGSIYVHCDWRVNSYLRMILDEAFGRDHFVNQISWQKIRSSKGQANGFGNVTDTIFLYARTAHRYFNKPYVPLAVERIEQHYSNVEAETGRRYMLDNFSQAGRGEAKKFGNRTLAPPSGKHWIWSQERIDEGVLKGEIVISESGMPRVKRYLDASMGNPVEDIWIDIPPINSQSSERHDYPTQKPEALLERIIKASSNESDLVADFFCGSGTTAAVAEKLNRKWIATDLGKFGIHTTRKRLIGVQRQLKAADKNFRAFEVLNLGRYERQAYLNVAGRLNPSQKAIALARKEAEFRELILRAYKAQELPNDAFFHGRLANRLVVIGPINLPVGRLFVEEVITECRKRGATRADILAFEFEMGLFPAVLDEAKGKGIDLAPRTIPPEVFDKRAVEKGQVQFFDISFIEARARYAPGKTVQDKLTLQIELTDFSVYYTQGAGDAAENQLKEGKSAVVCEQGQLIKIVKDKQGVITRETLTRHWTDWVDYWAVDFDYQSRKEIIRTELQDRPGEFAEEWHGSYIFENEWQSFRTRQNRNLELITTAHTYQLPGRYTVAVKVIDIFGNDTMTLVPVNVG